MTSNDLRGTFITRRRSVGWTAEQVALYSGHPIAGERGAQSAYVDRAAVALASAIRLAQENYADQSANESCKLACKPAKADGERNPRRVMEAWPGFEPGCTDLQSAA